MLSRIDPSAIVHCLGYYLFSVGNASILPSLGLFIAFPLLLASYALLIAKRNRRALQEANLAPFFAFALASVLVIIVFEALWAPHPTPRYRMDFAWLLGLAAFIAIGCACQANENPQRLSRVLGTLCLVTLVLSVLLALYPQNKNFTDYFAPEIKAMLGLS